MRSQSITIAFALVVGILVGAGGYALLDRSEPGEVKPDSDEEAVIAAAQEESFCPDWGRYSSEQRDQALLGMAKHLASANPTLQPLVRCAAERSAKEIATVGEACEREGDFLAGFVLGHLITVKLTECLNE